MSVCAYELYMFIYWGLCLYVDVLLCTNATLENVNVLFNVINLTGTADEMSLYGEIWHTTGANVN